MDEKVLVIEAKESILADNDADAEKLRSELRGKKRFYMNVMSSPGAGKTSVLLQTCGRLREQLRIRREGRASCLRRGSMPELF